MHLNQYDDIWMSSENRQGYATTDPIGGHLTVRDIKGVIPLDSQFGADRKKCVPDTLHDVLFGPLGSVFADLSGGNSDIATIGRMQTYAILDAAKIVNMAEMLEASGLEHRCLFKGETYRNLKDVAPWIVRLDEESDFTRALFTAGTAPWQLWGREAGIFVRSQASLEELWRRFRKIYPGPRRGWEMVLSAFLGPTGIEAAIVLA